MPQIEAIDTAFAKEARDLLPETWSALAGAKSFGPAALERRHNRVVLRTFGLDLTEEEIQALDDVVVEYVGKKFAIELITPGIDYWSKQIISQTAGERESETYQDRARDLRQLREDLLRDTATLWLDVEAMLPERPRRAQDMPRVIDAGTTFAHTTNNPYDIEPMTGPLEEIIE